MSLVEASHQPETLEALSRFLLQHERCGAGFDVVHPAGPGSGIVSITCRGCGARHEYSSATLADEPRLAGPAPAPTAAIPPRPAPYPEAPAGASAPPPTDAAPAIGTTRRSPRTALALVAIAAAALGAAVVLALNGGGANNRREHSREVSSARPPRAPSPSPASPARASHPPQTLHTPHFTVRVPQSWREEPSHGGLLLVPRRGDRASVQIYFQRYPTLSGAAMAAKTAAYLRHRFPAAPMSARAVRLGAGPARELVAGNPGETLAAFDVLRGPYRYLLVQRVLRGARQRTIRAATRIVRSFDPS